MSTFHTTGHWTALSVVIATAFVGCGGEKTAPPEHVATALVFDGPLADAVAGIPLASLDVKLVDEDGDVVARKEAITLRLERGDELVESFVAQVVSADGIASFTGITIHQAGDDYAFVTRSGDLPEARSATFSVAPAEAVALRLTGPDTATVGSAVDFQLVAFDAYGNEAAALPEGDVVIEASVDTTSTVAELEAGRADVSLTFLEPGSAWVTASVADSDLRATARVQVRLEGSIAGVDFFLSQLVTAGQPESGDLFVLDEWGNIVTGFVGDVSFSSTEPTDVLPQDVSFGSGDEGYIFFSGFEFTVAGERIITASVGGITASTTVLVRPGGVAEISFADIDELVVAGQPFHLAVVAHDVFGNRVSYAQGAVYVETDDQVVLPQWTPFLEDGIASLSNYALRLTGERSIRAHYNGLFAETVVNVLPAPTSGFRASLAIDGFGGKKSPTVAGAEVTLLIRAEDEFGNVATSFEGSIALAGAGVAVPAVGTFDSDSHGEIALRITPKVAPTATIEIEDADGVLPSRTVALTVEPAEAVSLLAEAPRTRLIPWEVEPLTITAYDAYGNVATGIDHNLTLRVQSSTHQEYLPDDPRLDIRFRKENAGVLEIPNALGSMHEGSFEITIDSDEGLSTSIAYEVNPANLPFEATWESDAAGERTTLTLAGTFGVPVPETGVLRVEFPPGTDFRTATPETGPGFIAPRVEMLADAALVHIGGVDDFAFRDANAPFIVTFHDVRNTSASGLLEGVVVTTETSFGARVATRQDDSRELDEAALSIEVLGEPEELVDFTIDGSDIFIGPVRTGRAYAFAFLEGSERAMDLSCSGDSWIAVHANRLVLEVPPFLYDHTENVVVTCATLAGVYTVTVQVQPSPEGLVNANVAGDALVQDLDGFALPSEDGHWVPMLFTNPVNDESVAMLYDTRLGKRIPVLPVDSKSRWPIVAGRAPVVALTVDRLNGYAFTHSQIVLVDLTTEHLDVISINDDGGAESGFGNGPSNQPVISPDGRYVLFYTASTNIVGQPGYVLHDRHLKTSRRVELPEGVKAEIGAYIGFSSDGKRFTLSGSSDSPQARYVFAIDAETLEATQVWRGLNMVTLARFARGGEHLLLSTYGMSGATSHWIRMDGAAPPMELCRWLELSSCAAIDTTFDGRYVMGYGITSDMTLESFIYDPATKERKSIPAPNDFSVVVPLGSARGKLMVLLADGMASSGEIAMLDLATMNLERLVGASGGTLNPAGALGVSTTADDSVVAYDSWLSVDRQEVWVRPRGGFARPLGEAMQPVVEATGRYVAGLLWSGVVRFDLLTGETEDVFQPVWDPDIGPIEAQQILGLSPGGRYLTIRSGTGDLVVQDTETGKYRRRIAPPVEDGPDEGQGYVGALLDASTFIRLNPATLGEKNLGTTTGLDVTEFHQVALTPDGATAAYLVETGAASDYEAGLRLFAEDVATGEVARLDFDSDGPLTSLDTSRGISLSADGRFVSFFSDGAPYVARVDYSLARKVVMPELTRPIEFVRLSGTGEQVFVSLRGATIGEDDHLYVFRNPFLVQ